jgi:hypothetical protein
MPFELIFKFAFEMLSNATMKSATIIVNEGKIAKECETRGTSAFRQLKRPNLPDRLT